MAKMKVDQMVKPRNKLAGPPLVKPSPIATNKAVPIVPVHDSFETRKYTRTRERTANPNQSNMAILFFCVREKKVSQCNMYLP